MYDRRYDFAFMEISTESSSDIRLLMNPESVPRE